jgi:hypothetical protein
MLSLWYDSQWIFQVSLSSGLLGEPYLVKGLARDAAREVGMKLEARVGLDEVLYE